MADVSFASSSSSPPVAFGPSNASYPRIGLTRNDTSSSSVASASAPASSSQVAHTLTACARCRQRKTRCDPGLPRCGPCVKTNSICEYYDANKHQTVNRSYVVHLQRKVAQLEEELERLDNDDAQDDPEAMMRSAAVRVHDAQETKFLGPSSGIAITRLVMQLAKQFTEAKSIREIVPDARAAQIKELYTREQSKPFSKVYPMISNVAATDLPNRDLTELLVQVYKLKVQPMYPALHEPTLVRDIEQVYSGPHAEPYQHFICRMVIAISLQKMSAEYAGLADSYYLAALNYLQPVVKPMDLRTLQCFALMAEYSMLTPTRTAIFYVVGIAVRLAQALGLNEERTVTRPGPDGKIDHLEVDMRRRLFWCVWTMDCGLAHTLGRPAMIATSNDRLDVDWFETCDDKDITPNGVVPSAIRPTLKKWVAIHFFKMRRLQLDIRRMLYIRKRPTPKDDTDPWFIQMEAKISAWRGAVPSQDEGLNLSKEWFTVRYNTIVVFLYRPSPQIPRPSAQAALKCFEACKWNIHIQYEQIEKKNLDLSWIFAQAVFMAINTILWSLSYVEVRNAHKRDDVIGYLEVAMRTIQIASERWPGVLSAIELYENLIKAVLKIYEKTGDVPISAATPSDAASPHGTSPATIASSSIATPDERPGNSAPFGHISHQARRNVDQQPQLPYGAGETPTPPAYASSDYMLGGAPLSRPTSEEWQPSQQTSPNQHPLPEFITPGFEPTHWEPTTTGQSHEMQPFQQHNLYVSSSGASTIAPFNAWDQSWNPSDPSYPFHSALDINNEHLMQQYWQMDPGAFGNGLDHVQQQELLDSLQAESGMEGIQSMISSTIASMTPTPKLQ